MGAWVAASWLLLFPSPGQAETPGDFPVPAQGWASKKANPKIAAMPDNSWLVLPLRFIPDGAPVWKEAGLTFGHGSWGHPKTESLLVYDEARNVTVWFGGCSAEYSNQTILFSVSDAVCYQAQAVCQDGKTKEGLRFANGRPGGQ